MSQQVSHDSLLAFRQTCKKAKIVVDNLPNFCADTWITLDRNSLRGFMKIDQTSLPLRNFYFPDISRLHRTDEFFHFTSNWAHRITRLRLRVLKLQSNSSVLSFLSSLTSLHSLEIDEIRSGSGNWTNLPLSLFSNIANLTIRKYNHSHDEYSDTESEESDREDRREVSSSQRTSLTPAMFSSNMIQALKGNQLLSHVSLNLKKHSIDSISSLIETKQGTSITFRFLHEEEIAIMFDRRFIRAVASSKENVRLVLDTTAERDFQQLMMSFREEMDVAQSFLSTVEFISTNWILKQIRPLSTPNLKGMSLLNEDDQEFHLPETVEEIKYTGWVEERPRFPHRTLFPSWPAALRTFITEICFIEEPQLKILLKSLALECPNLTSLGIPLWDMHTKKIFLDSDLQKSDEEEYSRESNLLANFSSTCHTQLLIFTFRLMHTKSNLYFKTKLIIELKNLKITLEGFKTPPGHDEILLYISYLQVKYLELNISKRSLDSFPEHENVENKLVGSNVTIIIN